MRPHAYLALAALGVGAVAAVACYPAAGNGVDPPALSFYYPVGLVVSRGGTVLYAVNADFDLQWNGGTIQSLDLHLIRRHAVMAINDPTDPNLPLAFPPPDGGNPCPNGPPVTTTLNDGGVIPGWACAPPTNASFYMRDSVAVGAFATDIQLSTITNPNVTGKSRLFTPIRGDASLTWADIVDDLPTQVPMASDTPDTYPPFRLDCGIRDSHHRCDAIHKTGNDPTQTGDTRLLTLPGEPFGMAQSEDGTSIVVTHQSSTDSTLFTSFTPGALFPPEYADDAGAGNLLPAIQFIVGNVPNGGVGIAAVPHTPEAFAECIAGPSSAACRAVFPRPAFLQTSRSSPTASLIRFYSDQGDIIPDSGADALPVSDPFRPFIQDEIDFPLNVNATGGTTDYARGIAIDPSPRIRCRAQLKNSDPNYNAELLSCAQLPARVFIASRQPPSLIIGQIGEPITEAGAYDPDLVIFTGSVPLPAGPSGVKIAPVVDAHGNYALRVFVVCFDSSRLIDYDPDQGLIEADIPVGIGPFALAFDPFDYTQAAQGKPVGVDPRDADLSLKTYRFGYIGSFSQSYMQVVDLDNSTADKSTWGTVVYTVGVPTNPVGGFTGIPGH